MKTRLGDGSKPPQQAASRTCGKPGRAPVRAGPIPLPGGELEYAVLRAVLDAVGAPAGEIHARVGKSKGLAYTTIAKVLERLRAKGLVDRERGGRAFLYSPRIDRAVLERARVEKLVARLLGSEPRPAVAMLVDAVEAVDPDLVDEMARIVAARRRSRRGP